jgi:hypothetical protein
MHSGLAGARVDQVIGADANDYITKLENAHGTEFGELLYPWHPRVGLRIGLTSRSRSRTALSFAVACAAAGLSFRLGRSIDPVWPKT